jgi:nucleotide-binding universal stress UspA family protein
VLKKILVALDSSDLSELVVQTLLQFQLQPKTEIIIAHVVFNAGKNPDIAADRPQVETESISHEALAKLQAYQAILPCKSELEIVTGDPAEEITRLANIHKADMIVIGSRGLTGMSRILQGSVSGQVAEEAHCSVLIVKPLS